jgi:hypothetical protein
LLIHSHGYSSYVSSITCEVADRPAAMPAHLPGAQAGSSAAGTGTTEAGVPDDVVRTVIEM